MQRIPWSRPEPFGFTRSDETPHHAVGRKEVGVSGSSSDVRDLLARESTDAHAAEAVELFCYQAKKWLGAFAAVLGGIDTLVFAGGIGENSPLIRERICSGLGFLGIEIDAQRNANNAAVIATDAGRVRVRVMRTDEEIMIARAVADTVWGAI